MNQADDWLGASVDDREGDPCVWVAGPAIGQGVKEFAREKGHVHGQKEGPGSRATGEIVQSGHDTGHGTGGGDVVGDGAAAG